MLTYKTLLFDLDGTLFNSRDSIVQATYDTLCRFVPGRLSYEEVNARFGEPFAEFVTGTGLAAKADEMLAFYMEHVEKNHHRLVRSYPFVERGIPLLRETYQLAIVTNKERRLAMHGLHQFGLADHFDAIVCIEDVRAGKPSAEPIQKAISLLGADPTQCLMVGDTIFDIEAASNAGVDSALMRYEGNGKMVKPSTYEFTHFQELVAFLLTEMTEMTKVGVGRESR